MILICPNCQSELKAFSSLLKCSKGHSFDQAKQGYFNLLLPNQKKTLDPGDNKEMISAREHFLSAGHYDFLLQAINDRITESASSSFTILDIGCGNGYYTRNLKAPNAIGKKVGIDVSKTGISTAAKKDNHSTYIVSSAFNLPIQDQSVDYILNVFAPIDLGEAHRVLKEEGKIIKVIPGENHMNELAIQIYEDFKPHSTAIFDQVGEHKGFEISEKKELSDVIKFSVEEIKELISMTPYKYRFTDEKFSQLLAMAVTISFEIIEVVKSPVKS